MEASRTSAAIAKNLFIQLVFVKAQTHSKSRQYNKNYIHTPALRPTFYNLSSGKAPIFITLPLNALSLWAQHLKLIRYIYQNSLLIFTSTIHNFRQLQFYLTIDTFPTTIPFYGVLRYPSGRFQETVELGIAGR